MRASAGSGVGRGAARGARNVSNNDGKVIACCRKEQATDECHQIGAAG